MSDLSRWSACERLRREHGQTLVEYLGVLALVAAIVVVIAASGFSGKVADAIGDQICRVTGGECGGGGGAAAVEVVDSDNDGATDAEEAEAGTNPEAADTDGDGLTDGDELDLIDENATGSADESPDPLRPDRDGDGLTDAQEVAVGTPPGADDFDRDGHGGLSDGLTDAEEIELGTDPRVIDTDGDGTSDGDEVADGSDPLEDERSGLDKAASAVSDFILDDPTVVFPSRGISNLIGKGVTKRISKSAKAVDETDPRAAAKVRRDIAASVGAAAGRKLEDSAAVWRGKAGTRSQASSRLNRNLKAQGPKPDGTAAHHLVPIGTKKNRDAVEAQAVMERFGIDPNDAANGVFLPCRSGCVASGAYHPSLHTSAYYREVGNRLKQAGTKSQALSVLKRIRKDLEADQFPH